MDFSGGRLRWRQGLFEGIVRWRGGAEEAGYSGDWCGGDWGRWRLEGDA